MRVLKTGRDGQRHQRVNSDGRLNGVFQSYSGRIQSLPGIITHKRGKSGQNEGLLKTTLEEIEDGTGVNSNYNDDMAIIANEEAKDYSAIPDGDQTAFIEHEVNDGSAIINHESSIASDRSLQQNEHVMERASSTENLNMIGGNMM